MIWERINPDKPFRYVCDEPFVYDVQKRIPAVEKICETRLTEPRQRRGAKMCEMPGWPIEAARLGDRREVVDRAHIPPLGIGAAGAWASARGGRLHPARSPWSPDSPFGRESQITARSGRAFFNGFSIAATTGSRIATVCQSLAFRRQWCLACVIGSPERRCGPGRC